MIDYGRPCARTLELRQLVLRSSRPRAHQRCILFIAWLDLLSGLISLS
ncbi:MAG: hypothetical protein MGAcid_14560 [uncultured Acidilobus sp. MG]|nr:MAG: hypothetical protein MGAcid_14560 [uncultured Acidilobus sp. MG]